ncbi:MAG: YoaK family protein [Candidatus Sulfotelmatobacter sp.]
MLSNFSQTDMWLSLGLAFVGGYGDAAGFVLARTFTGHLTGNLVLGAIAAAAHDWRAMLGHLSAIVTFLIGIVLSVLLVRPLKAWSSWPLLPTIMGIEIILILAASLALASGVAHGVEIFVIFVSLALGLQNGAFRRAGGISVHTTYLTGMITSLISTEAEQYASQVVPPPVSAHDPKISLLCGIWIAFVLGAGTGAAMVLHFGAFGMLGAALPLITLVPARGAGLTTTQQNERP